MGYFKDDKGQKSMTRLLVFIAAITAYVISLATVGALIYFSYISTEETPRELQGLMVIVELVVTLLAYAGLKKIFQKKYETQDKTAS